MIKKILDLKLVLFLRGRLCYDEKDMDHSCGYSGAYWWIDRMQFEK